MECHKPGDSKWPFYPPVGRHLSFEKVTFPPSQKGHDRRIARRLLFVAHMMMFFETSVNSQKNRKHYKLCAEEIVVTTKCVLKAFTPNPRASTKRLKKYTKDTFASVNKIRWGIFGWFFLGNFFIPKSRQTVPWKSILTISWFFFSGWVNHVWKEWQWDFSGQIIATSRELTSKVSWASGKSPYFREIYVGEIL